MTHAHTHAHTHTLQRTRQKTFLRSDEESATVGPQAVAVGRRLPIIITTTTARLLYSSPLLSSPPGVGGESPLRGKESVIRIVYVAPEARLSLRGGRLRRVRC